jgi:hypothetical protein
MAAPSRGGNPGNLIGAQFAKLAERMAEFSTQLSNVLIVSLSMDRSLVRISQQLQQQTALLSGLAGASRAPLPAATGSPALHALAVPSPSAAAGGGEAAEAGVTVAGTVGAAFAAVAVVAGATVAAFSGLLSATRGYVAAFSPQTIQLFNYALNSLRAGIGYVFQPLFQIVTQLTNEISSALTPAFVFLREYVDNVAGIFGGTLTIAIKLFGAVLEAAAPAFQKVGEILADAMRGAALNIIVAGVRIGQALTRVADNIAGLFGSRTSFSRDFNAGLQHLVVLLGQRGVPQITGAASNISQSTLEQIASANVRAAIMAGGPQSRSVEDYLAEVVALLSELVRQDQQPDNAGAPRQEQQGAFIAGASALANGAIDPVSVARFAAANPGMAAGFGAGVRRALGL